MKLFGIEVIRYRRFSKITVHLSDETPSKMRRTLPLLTENHCGLIKINTVIELCYFDYVIVCELRYRTLNFSVFFVESLIYYFCYLRMSFKKCWKLRDLFLYGDLLKVDQFSVITVRFWFLLNEFWAFPCFAGFFYALPLLFIENLI